LDGMLSKEEYERKRTVQQMHLWIETAHAGFRKMETAKRFRVLGNGIGKKFIKEMHPLNLFAQLRYSARDDISVQAILGNQSFDARVFEGHRELCKVEITEAIDGARWALQKELFLQDGWFPGTGKIECISRKHNRKKGDIKAELEAVKGCELVQETVHLIEEVLDKKFNKSYGSNTWLLVAFDDTTALHPDGLKPDDKRKLCDSVQGKIHSAKPTFEKIFLIGWSGKSLYEFQVTSR
jgi:hypothetical protein